MNITELDVAYTGVGSVDISKYKKLVTYRCAGNNLTKLDVTKNKKLRTLDCQKNRLKYLDLRKSTNLTNIELNDNELTSLILVIYQGWDGINLIISIIPLQGKKD